MAPRTINPLPSLGRVLFFAAAADDANAIMEIHLEFSVAQQACLICGRKPSDPHHLRYMQPRALGRRPSDEFAVPLCRSHHRSSEQTEPLDRGWERKGISLRVGRRNVAGLAATVG
jgi:hypothetical protein